MSVRHDHEHERTERKTSRLQPTHTRVGAFPQSHPGLCGTLVGPDKDTHAVGARTRRPTNDNTTKTSLKTNVLSAKPGVNTHLETCMVAEPVRETGDLRRIVELREQTRR